LTSYRGVLGGVLSLHPTDEDDLRLEGFVFQQVKNKSPLSLLAKEEDEGEEEEEEE